MTKGLDTTEALAERPRADARRVLVAAASSGRNLSFAAAVGLLTLGLALGGLPALAATLLVFGMLIYVSMVGLDACSPRFIARELGGTGLGGPGAFELLPLSLAHDPAEIRSPHLRRLYEAILIRHEELRLELQRADDRLKERLGDAFARCTVLAHQARELIEQGDILFEYLGRQRREDIEARASSLEIEAKTTKDRRASETFARAAALQWEHHASHVRLQGAFDRVKAQLGAILASIEGTSARAVRLRADPVGAALAADELNEKLGALESELGILEAAVDEASEQ